MHLQTGSRHSTVILQNELKGVLLQIEPDR